MMKTCESGIPFVLSLFLSAILAYSSPLHAQSVFDCSGYVAEFAAFSRVNETIASLRITARDQSFSITRLRLRPAWRPWDGTLLSMEYEASAFFHSAPAFLLSANSENRRQVLDLTWTPRQTEQWTVTHFIDRICLRQEFGAGELTLGRQRIAWGSGRIWNPTDLFNPLNPAVVSKVEKDGVDAAMVKVAFGDFTDLSLVCNPQRGWKDVNAGFRFRTNVREFDLSAVGGMFDRRVIVGGDFAGNLFDAGVRGEAVVSFDSRRNADAFSKVVLGADYQLTAEFYGLIEYHWNGEGTADRARYDLFRLASGEILNLAQDYLALSASYLIHPLVSLLATASRNLDDGSGYTNLSASYSATDEISIVIGAQVFDGKRGSEYWWYPDAAYIKADIWF